MKVSLMQQTNITLQDGRSPQVLHTFAPKGARMQADKKNVAVWRDQSSGVAAGYHTITETHTPTNSNGMEKFRYVFDIPVLESPASGGTFAPPPTRAFGTIGTIEVWAHERASEGDMKDVVNYLKEFASSQQFFDAITKRESAW